MSDFEDDDFDDEEFDEELLLEKLPPFVRTTPKIGANQPCPCGSKKKYKKCCRDKLTRQTNVNL